jgi:predicted MFS family arabinose efflux permease
MAAVGDHFPTATRASALGWVNAGFGISALAGVPAVGAIAGAFGWRPAFVAMGIATLILAALIWSRLPDGGVRGAGSGGLAAAYLSVLRSPGLLPILGANVLERSVFATVGLYLASYLIQSYGISLLDAAALLAMIAIGTIVGNIAGGRLADRGSQPLVYGTGQILSAVFALGYFLLSPGLAASVALGACFGLATSASRPGIIAMATAISTRHRGTALGIFSFTNQLGWAVGPAAAGLGFALAGYPAIGILCGLASVGAAALMLGLAAGPASEPRP